MPTPAPRPSMGYDAAHTSANADPVVLWRAVVEARTVLAEQRQMRPGPSVLDARLKLLTALETYVGSLVRRGWPVPYAVRDELRIQQRVCSPDRPQRDGR